MKKFICFIFSTLLIGCIATQSEKNDMFRMSERQLCMEYMTLPTINRLQDAREEVIRARKIDCWKYGNVAAERRKADADMRFSQPDSKRVKKTQCVRTGDVINCTTQ